jgi:hypothetical protein
MALVILGSRRVTRDFDFVIARPGERLQRLVDLFYDRGFELASRVNEDGDVTATIDNRRAAGTRLRLDAPASAYFFNPDTGLRIDLLFDFPIPAATLAADATLTKVRSRVLRVASEAISCVSSRSPANDGPYPATPRTSPFSRHAGPGANEHVRGSRHARSTMPQRRDWVGPRRPPRRNR